MCRSAIIMLLLCGPIIKTLGQTGWPIYLDDKTIWCLENYSTGDIGWDRVFYSYYVSGDTILESKTFYQVHCAVFGWESSWGEGSGPGSQCGPVGGIRIEDGRLEFYKYERDYWSCTDCVWPVENIPTNEVITLVDLNMSIGDTIFFQKNVEDYNLAFVLDTIFEVEIEGTIYEDYFFDHYAVSSSGIFVYFDSKEWLTGLGDYTYGPFSAYREIVFGGGVEYNGYISGGEVLWGDPARCLATDLIDDNQSNKLTISPNPNNGTFLLQSDTWMDAIRLYSGRGQQVYQLHDAGLQTTIDLPLDPGMYLLHIIRNDQLVQKKFIVQL